MHLRYYFKCPKFLHFFQEKRTNIKILFTKGNEKGYFLDARELKSIKGGEEY